MCPKDSGPLTKASGGIVCDHCATLYPVDQYGVTLLDVVHNPEAHAFDEQHESFETMSEGEIASSISLAQKYLDIVGKRRDLSQPGLTVMDVGCGKGELTIGLASDRRLQQANIYAFDHSLLSLHALARTAARLKVRDNIELSQQDIDAMGFPASSFDVVFGNAVLHHFLDWRRFLRKVTELLRPGGVVVLAEPFVDGYVIPIAMFKLAVMAAQVRDTAAPDMGLYDFIVDNVSTRIRNRDDLSILAKLTDKHFFGVEDLLKLSNEVGLKLEFEPYEAARYYDSILADLLKTYRITNHTVVDTAKKFFAAVKAMMGEQYAALFPHFRFVILSKPLGLA
jgi:2-polyprenyl-3-methyl-5-hydroxy-6-metoxy-1,4-benzoquinol methylase